MPTVLVRIDVLKLMTRREVRTKVCEHPEGVGKKFCPECGCPDGKREAVSHHVGLIKGCVVEPALEPGGDLASHLRAPPGSVTINGIPMIRFEERPLDDVLQRTVILGLPLDDYASFEAVSAASDQLVEALGPIGITEVDVLVS